MGNGHFAGMAAAARMGGGQRREWRPITFAADFPGFDAAWDACMDDAQFQVWDCSRRSAKTGTASRRTVMRSSERANHRTLYIHHTRELAKMQFFETGEAVGSKANPGVIELLKQHGIDEAKHDLSELWVRLRNGSFVQAVGCDNIRDVDRKLGYLWDDILIDECQDHDDELLRRLVDKTLLPTMIDRGGTMTLMGTPPEVEAGLWFEVSNPSGSGCWKRHHWTLLENPFIERANIISVYEKRGFPLDFGNHSNNDPIVQREIFGLHVVDPASLMYCYLGGVDGNDWPLEGIPSPDSEHWRFSIGVDIGGMDEGDDEDAVVILGWLNNDPQHRIWERESWAGKADSEEFLALLSGMFGRWRPMQAGCGDAGADKMLVYFKRRMDGIKLLPKPSSLEVSRRLLNDEFRSRRLRLNPLGRIACAARTCRRTGHESDVLAAARYAYHAATAFMAKQEEKPAPKDRDTEIREQRWNQRREERRRLEDPWNQEGGWTG